jgi:nicotinate-nucleotide adenylyltransferase
MARMTARVGVLGGTFDPPHIGHLVIAQQALTQLNLSQVIFAPSRQPPHKMGQAITSIEHRLEMVRLAIGADPCFALSRVDVDREGPTYSVDALRILREGWDKDTEIYFLMGMDSLASILSWHKPAELIRLCKLAVFARPGFNADIDALEKKLPGIRGRVVFLSAPPLEISATEIQRRVHAGESIRDLVPPMVAEYIETNGLYRTATFS